MSGDGSSQTDALEALSAWIASAGTDHGPVALSRARAAVIDTVAVTLAGVSEPVARKVRATTAAWGAGPCTVIGTAERAPAPWAALANGAAAHALDFDDHELIGLTHPSAVLVPALLACAESRGASGRQLLDGYVVGLEVIMRLGQAVNMSHYHIGWHATATLGAFGAAAACARLIGLDQAGAAAALGLASSMAAGSKSQFGTMAKPLHAGLAAKAGLMAAGLAENGVTAAGDILDGRWSLVSLYGGPEARGFAEPMVQLGEPLAIEQFGVVVKCYPCCGYTHPAVDGVLALRAAHGFTARDIARVRAIIPARDADILDKPRPETPLAARFSMEHCLAAAIVTGELAPSAFTPAAIADPEIRRLLPLVSLERHPVTAASRDPTRQEPQDVEITLTDGRVLSATVTDQRGTPRQPLSEAELFAKLRACAEGVVPVDAAEEILRRLEDLPSVDALMAPLRPGPRQRLAVN